MIGFYLNFHSPDIFCLSELGFDVNLLWGLLFPLLISLVWGWRYGLLSALFGGCQSMWWLWSSDGYGLFYSVPIYTLWIVWHGYWQEKLIDAKEWYKNKYIMEIVFRIFSAVGFYTIFRFLVSLNPPIWNQEILNNEVPLLWVNSVVIKHVVTAYILLLISDILLNIKSIRKFFKLNNEIDYTDISLINCIYISAGILYWIIDTIYDYLFYYNDNFYNLLLFKIPERELITRITVLLLSIISGNIISYIIKSKKSLSKKYKILFENINDAVYLYEACDENFIDFNKEAYNLLDYNKKELLTKSPEDINIYSTIKKITANKKKNIKYESYLINKNKEKISVEIKSGIFKLNDKEFIISIARDISERKEYEEILKSQKEELFASYEQLEADSEEIMAMNEELNQSMEEIFDSNKRFASMVDIVSSLGSSSFDEKSFLENLLKTVMEIVPEADYGKICLVVDNNNCEFINTIGHDFNLLKDIKIKKDLFLHSKEKNVFTSDEYSLNLEELNEELKQIFKKALKPISQSIYINITVKNEIMGRITLDIAEESNKNFTKTTKKMLESFACLASAFFSFQRYNKLQGQFTKELILSITHILEMYDRYTKGHSESVAELSANLAQRMGLSQEEITATYWAGMVHDIGKLLVPLKVLNKKGSLTENEYKIIKKHPIWGYEALNKSESLIYIAEYVLYHHERWDGNGYPQGLKENEIPLISQIIAVADAWDAMTSKRSYRAPLSREKAIEEIKKNKGRQFSPEVADVFLKMNNIIDKVNVI